MSALYLVVAHVRPLRLRLQRRVLDLMLRAISGQPYEIPGAPAILGMPLLAPTEGKTTLSAGPAMAGAAATTAATATLASIVATASPKTTRITAPAAGAAPASALSLTVTSKLPLFGSLGGKTATVPNAKAAASVKGAEAERSAEPTQLAMEMLATFDFAGLSLTGFANAVLVPLLASDICCCVRSCGARRRHCHRA